MVGHHDIVLQYRKKVSMAGVADEISLTRGVHAEYFSPNGHQQRPKLPSAGLQQLQNVGKDTH